MRTRSERAIDIRLESQQVANWPPLAWLARLHPAPEARIELLYGRGVEIRDRWFAEAVWDAPFDDGRFDRTDVVVGSGAFIDDDRATFVTSDNNLDRLHVLRNPQGTIVSNSLACLLAFADAELSPTYAHYHRDFRSIIGGVGRYKRFIRTSAGQVELVYYDNLVWDGEHLVVTTKPQPPRSFRSFDDYHEFLRRTLERVVANAADRRRTYRYDLLGTLSGGYDSSMVMSLAREVGCRRALFFSPPTPNADSAAWSIADHLGIELIPVGLDDWRGRDGSEIEFIAGLPDAEEIRFAGAREHLGNTLLLSGSRGDGCWGLEPRPHEAMLSRRETQGVSLCETRLWYGFQHCALPAWGVRNRDQIWAISRSEEMRPWRIGGDYDRPICRRIIEDAGVPRGSFAKAKEGQSPPLQRHERFLTEGSWTSFERWLNARRERWYARGRLPPDGDVARDLKRFEAMKTKRRLIASLPLLWRYNPYHKMPTRLRRFVFAWALDVVRARYRAAIEATAGVNHPLTDR